ncbi:MAG: bifunctional folylpolyglutamate synthase/dihydrofolate synthase [Oligoflexia bacterium]|nr:bifunctional folylpolyglutamate synthase/dihydrofolate synthase [Oligoflexia bacterium]
MKSSATILDRVYGLADTGIKLGLDNMRRAMERLELDLSGMRLIHVAGTNGKGSTCAMLQSLIMRHTDRNIKTGLYTSPHLLRFNERIRINNDLISDEDIDRIGGKIMEKCRDISLTFFEFTALLAFIYFAENKVSFAVIETGLGGRLDATNVITPEIAVITSIGIDHTSYLGNTIEEIAREKAGIFKKGSNVIISGTPCNLLLKKEAVSRGARAVYSLGEDILLSVEKNGSFSVKIKNEAVFDNLSKSLRGAHQYYNAAAAVTALFLLDLPASPDSINDALAKTEWKGRLQYLNYRGSDVLIDVSHNTEGIRALIDFLRSKYAGKKISVACGFLRDKEYVSMINELSQVAEKIFLFPVTTGDRGLSYDDYNGNAGITGNGKVTVCRNFTEAASNIINGNGVRVFTGSTYNYENIYNYFKGEQVCI